MRGKCHVMMVYVINNRKPKCIISMINKVFIFVMLRFITLYNIHWRNLNLWIAARWDFGVIIRALINGVPSVAANEVAHSVSYSLTHNEVES